METTQKRQRSVSLVLETNNLRSAEDASEVCGELEALFGHLRGQTYALERLEELVVTHEGLPEGQRDRLAGVAGRDIDWVRISPEAGYYQAKNAGFDATSADVVAFGDADCRPVPGWLSKLVDPLVEGESRVVAGHTVYDGGLFGRAASSVDFLYVDDPGDPGTIRNFFANNVAFERELFDAYRYRADETVRRGHCLDLALRLQRDGVSIRYAPGARTTHEWPERLRDVIRKRLLRGSDASQVARRVVETHVPDLAARHLDSETRATAAVLAGRLVYSLRASDGGKEKVAVLGLSALDVVGAALRLSSTTDFGIRDGRIASGSTAIGG